MKSNLLDRVALTVRTYSSFNHDIISLISQTALSSTASASITQKGLRAIPVIDTMRQYGMQLMEEEGVEPGQKS